MFESCTSGGFIPISHPSSASVRKELLTTKKITFSISVRFSFPFFILWTGPPNKDFISIFGLTKSLKKNHFEMGSKFVWELMGKKLSFRFCLVQTLLQAFWMFGTGWNIVGEQMGPCREGDDREDDLGGREGDPQQITLNFFYQKICKKMQIQIQILGTNTNTW